MHAPSRNSRSPDRKNEASLVLQDELIQEKGRRDAAQDDGKDSRQTAASQCNASTDSRRVIEDSPEVVSFEFRIIGKNLAFASARREPIQDIPDRDAQSPDTRLARTFSRLDSDANVLHSILMIAPKLEREP